MTDTTTTPSQDKRLKLGSVLIVVIALCAIGIGTVALDRTMRLRRDRQTIEWADKAMADGRYEDAAAQFARAVARHPDDADLSLKSGDAFYALSASKPEALQKARVAWEAAARLRPSDPVPLRRLLRFQTDLAEVRPIPVSFRELGEIAGRVAAVSPTDKDAAIARVVALLAPWFSQTAPPSAAESAAHDRLIADLGALQQSDPPASEAIIYYALANSRRAAELRQTGANGAAQQLLDRAEQQIADATARAGQHDSQVPYRAAEGMTILAETYQRIDQMPLTPANVVAASQPATTRPASTMPAATQLAATSPARAPQSMWPAWDVLDHHVKWVGLESGEPRAKRIEPPTTQPISVAATQCLQQARLLAARAAAASTSSDAHFVDVRLLEADLAQANGDLAAAEQICRDTLAARPGSLRAQLSLANLVGTSHPDQAMAILDQPETADDAGPGPMALIGRVLQIESAMQQARLHLDAATAADDATVRQAHIQKASTACDALVAMLVNDSASLKLTGRLRMLQGRYADALRAVETAIAMSRARGSGDLELFELQASALLALHEAEPALESLRAVLEADPSRSADRVLLTGTLIDDARISEAEKQVILLEKQLANDPRVLELRVRLLVAANAIDPADATAKQLHEAYSKVPEVGAKQQLAKAELAMSAGDAADAVRLLGAARVTEPGSIPLAVKEALALIAEDKADKARPLVADALRQHPGEPALLAVQKSLDGPALPEAYERELSGDNAKELLAAVHAARAALDVRDLPRAKEQIDAVKRLRPDEPLLSDVQFRYDLATEQWGEAGISADKLAQINFDHMGGLSYRFELYRAHAQLLAAVCVARQMTLRYENFAAGWLAFGDILQSVGQYDRAIESFHKALSIEHANLHATKGLAACLTSAGRGQEADEWIGKGRKLAPADSGFREMELVRQLAQGDPHRLIAAREAAIRAEPQRPDNVVALARVHLRISSLETIANPKGARDAVKKATELLDGAVKKWPDDLAASFWAAHASAIAGDVAGGKQILRRLCDRIAWATRPDAEQLLADFCLTWGDPSLAEVAMRGAMARGADGAPMARRLAGLLMRQGSWRPALDALRRFPADPLTQQQRVAIFLAAGGAAEAEKELKNAYAANPANVRVITLLGMLYAAERNDAAAKLWLDRAVAAGGEDLADRERGALRLREQTPDTAAALREISTAWEARLSDDRAAQLLSEAWAGNGNAARAARVLETALTITPPEKNLRLSLIALEEGAASPNWEKVATVIQEGRLLAPSDFDWDVAEARMWSSRQDAGNAAALMRHAVLLAETAPQIADATVERQEAGKIRALVPDELWMLLAAHDHDLALAEADDVIARYGLGDLLSAWAHHAKAAVQRRTGRDDGGAAEYNSAIATALNAGGFQSADAVVETISAEAGADEAIRRINGYLATVDGPRRETSGTPPAHDPRWDLLRIDLLRRNNELSAAAAEIDKLMPRLASFPEAIQIQLLRMAVVVYMQDASSAHSDKPRLACLELLRRLPNDTWALNNMAVVYIDFSRTADPEKAVEYGLRAYQAAGQSGEVDLRIADTYGWALAMAGRGKEAIAVLTPVAQRLLIPEVQYHLAEAYLAAATPGPAWSHLETALQLIHRDENLKRPIDASLRSGMAKAFWRAVRETGIEELNRWMN
jgi:tetratricopeptide (TPR) repeat protein